MEDSGFDSDSKIVQNGSNNGDVKTSVEEKLSERTQSHAFKAMRRASDLQKKMEKQREAVRRTQAIVDNQPRRSILSRGRLLVPGKSDQTLTPAPDQQPLVMIETDESEDEYEMPQLSRQAQMEITQQLIKDGYNLDLEPDDEDLDLIPPRPLHERCVCCAQTVTCSIQ